MTNQEQREKLIDGHERFSPQHCKDRAGTGFLARQVVILIVISFPQSFWKGIVLLY